MPLIRLGVSRAASLCGQPQAGQGRRWLNMMRFSIITLSTFVILAGCSVIQQSEFERLCHELSVRPQVAAILQHYQSNRGGDNKEIFEILLTFCIRRQIAGPRNRYPDLADPILDVYAVSVLLGPLLPR